MKAISSLLPRWKPEEPVISNEKKMRKIEDYRPGYPRYTSLLSAHGPYFMCRGFNKIRARILLLKQDKLSMLEQRLEEIDQQETSPLFLGKSRCDRNMDRTSLLAEIEATLVDYDRFAENTHRMINLSQAGERDVQSLRNWLDGNGCLAREETEYLSHRGDLVSLAAPGDNAVVQLETWVEDKVIRFYRGFRDRRFHNISNDSNVYIYSGLLIKRTAKGILLLVITLFLLAPVVICNSISAITYRIVVVMISIISYLLVLSGLTMSRTMELILAGVTYATVLIVFVSGTSGFQN